MSPDLSSGALTGDARAILSSLAPLDWLLLVIAVFSVTRGFLHGAIREIFALVASIAALVTAYWEYRPVADWLRRWVTPASARDVAAFLLVACAVFLAVALAGRIVQRAAHMVGLGPLDRLAGAVLGLARAAVLCTLLLSAITAFLPASPWIAESRLALPLAHTAKLLAAAAPPDLERRIMTGVGNLLRLQAALR